MQPIRTFNVAPALPPQLEPLRQLAFNLHWDWNVETRDLFRRLDRDLWESSHHNPVLMLGTISQERLKEVAEDDGFLAQMDRAARQLASYLRERAWYRKHRGDQVQIQECYAYFSAEFGLTDCLPIYSGGLGVLAGDHLKSASDLGLPLVGVGLLYQEGYFAQYLNADGWQQEQYPTNDFYNMPLHLERNPDGSELRIRVDYPTRQVHARVWRVQVGTVPLYMLDTNIEPNSQYDQNITDELYGGDMDVRIHQEIMLGIGGVKMLQALGYQPTVYHMNEGHSAFLSLERIRLLMEEGLGYEEALEVTRSSQIFTTHTPVPAGFDLFPSDKVMYYLGNYGAGFGLQREEFLALGREDTGDFSAPFSMATLAIKLAHFVNGVSLRGGSAQEIDQAQEALDPAVFSIGFSRRFATYKRANLILRDRERLKRILCNRDQPVQIVFAGKAHPKDIPGKELIRDIIHFIQEEGMRHNVVFVPNYDIHVGRLMVAGCDIWLNNPRRPREASGTSGMKAAMNGLFNLSILDGWWDEADYVRTGWPVGHGEIYDDLDYQDEVEANAMYDLLEQAVLPLFYKRDENGIPRGWVAKMKDAIRLNCPYFNTARMLADYATHAYFPTSNSYAAMRVNSYAPARTLAQWKQRIFEHWYDIKILDIDVSTDNDIQVNQVVAVKARLNLGALTDQDIQVQLYKGSVGADGQIVHGMPVVMDYHGKDNQGCSVYMVDVSYGSSGLQGFALRVLPKHEYLSNPHELRLVLWAEV